MRVVHAVSIFHSLVAVWLLAGHAEAGLADRLMIDSVLTSQSFAGPLGFQRLCEQDTGLCRNHQLYRPLIHSDKLKRLLSRVQSEVNAGIRPAEESAGMDHWQFFPAMGDCEDYALSKYQRLLEAGIQPGDMRFAVGFTESGEYHAVLLIETTKGTTVLDNRFDVPISWELSIIGGYRWIAAQKRGEPQTWLLTKTGQNYARQLEEDQYFSGAR